MLLGNNHHGIPQFDDSTAVRNDDLPFPDNGTDQDILFQLHVFQRYAYQIGDPFLDAELAST